MLVEIALAHHMMKKRRILFIVIAIILTGIAIAYAAEKLRCPQEIETHIGWFDSKDTALRASIVKLANEIRSCPKAELYRVIWVSPEPELVGSGMSKRCIFYNRSRQGIGYEADVYSGGFGRGYIADDAAIRDVAEKGGTLEDFKVNDRSR